MNWRGILAACVLIVLGACSHTSPHYRDGKELVSTAERSDIAHRLLLIGDAGAPAESGEPTLLALETYARSVPNKTTIVFLGDNIYKYGLPDQGDSRQEEKRRLDAQIDVLRTSQARGIFIPGNHDWAKGKPEGWKHILNFDTYVDTVANDEHVPVHSYPSGGCPGPTRVNLGDIASLVILDTQWWIHNYRKPNSSDPAGCSYVTEKEVLMALQQQLLDAAASGQCVVVAAHHPLRSEGPHAGFASLRSHIFPLTDLHKRVWIPLPIIGSIVAVIRRVRSPSSQDLSNPAYAHMRTMLIDVLKEVAGKNAAPVAYAAGHDHSLQVIEGSEIPSFHLVSGNGSKSKTTDVGDSTETLFAHSNPGFMVIDFMRNGAVRLAVIEAADESGAPMEVYSVSKRKCN